MTRVSKMLIHISRTARYPAEAVGDWSQGRRGIPRFDWVPNSGCPMEEIKTMPVPVPAYFQKR